MFSLNPTNIEYYMEEPSVSFLNSRFLNNVGIYYCGPVHIKEKKYGNTMPIKKYVAVFVYLVMEAVLDLTTENFSLH